VPKQLPLYMVLLLSASFACIQPSFGLQKDAADAQKAPTTNSGSKSQIISSERLDSTPDLMQSLPEAKLPRNGYTYCGPVAVSNSLIWLSRNGYPKLAPPDCKEPIGQGSLALQLAQYFHTTGGKGTSPTMLLNGINKYVSDRGYKVKSLQYEGWQQHPKAFSVPGEDTAAASEDIDWIKRGLVGHSAVWLMIGWYKYSPKTDTYSPYAQHWVSLVGCGKDKAGKPDPDILIIHDPAPRSGAILSHDYVRVERLGGGAFAKGSGRPKSAAGWYKLGGDLKIKKGADCGLIDGAVVLQLI
jgi:hypothetical protein